MRNKEALKLCLGSIMGPVEVTPCNTPINVNPEAGVGQQPQGGDFDRTSCI